MNIAEILKDCPKGTKLYSPLFGECELVCSGYKSNDYPIIIKAGDENHCFTKMDYFIENIQMVNACYFLLKIIEIGLHLK